jgi:hypothetical protein
MVMTALDKSRLTHMRPTRLHVLPTLSNALHVTSRIRPIGRSSRLYRRAACSRSQEGASAREQAVATADAGARPATLASGNGVTFTYRERMRLTRRSSLFHSWDGMPLAVVTQTNARSA